MTRFCSCLFRSAALLFTLGLFVLMAELPATQAATASPLIDETSTPSRRLMLDRPVRIGIITLPESLVTDQALDETVEALRRAYAPYPVEASVMQTEVLEEHIKAGTVDAFIASAGYFSRMMKYGVVRVGTLISAQAPDPNNSAATAFIVRADSNLYQLADLQGKTASGSFATAFMSLRIALAELAHEGYDPEHFFGNITYTGNVDNDRIVSLLDSNAVDVAIVAACWLETLPAEKRREYRVINAKEDVMRCAHSTRTYPGITVGVTQGASPGVAHVMAETLLSMPVLSSGYHWGLATDMRAVDRLYKELKLEQYAYLREWSVNRWLKAYWYWCVFALMGVVGLAFHSWRSERLVRIRTAALVNTMREKEAAQKRADAFRERTERMQKATIVGQLSNMIAHELSQPLAAIKYYCEGQKALIENDNLDKKMLEMSLKGIEGALTRTTAIVEKVLSYNRGGTQRDSAVELEQTLENVIAGLNPEQLSQVHISIGGLEHVAIEADPLEVEVLFTNLLKNAVEAALEVEKPEISIHTERVDARLVITISNSGVLLTDDDVQRLQTPFISTKARGRGLGVSIAMAIAEASGGHITFKKRPQGGLMAILTLNEA